MQIRYLISRLWKEQPLRFSLSVVALTVVGLLEGVGVAAIVPMLQIVQTGDSAASSVGWIGQAMTAILGIFHLPFNLPSVLAFVLVLILASEGATLLQQKVQASSAALLEANLRTKLFRAVFEAGWPFFLRTKTNDLMSALMNDTNRASNAYTTLAQTIGAIIMMLVYLALVLALSWQMTLAIVIVSALVVFLLRSRANRGTKFGQDFSRVDADIQSATAEDMAAAKLVKASSCEAAVRERFDVLTAIRQRVQYRNAMNQAWLRMLYDSTAIVTVFVGIYAAVTFFRMSIASLTVFLFAYYRLSPRIASLQSNQSLILSFVPGLMRVDEYTAAAEALRERSGDAPLKKFSDAIRLDDVSFAYDSEHTVLHHIGLVIPHGQSTAIVGPSGAGKTTVMDLIMGLVLPQSGDILIDGASLKDIHLSDWRRQIGYVPQDASFFHATVADNIAWGFEDASHDEVLVAAKLADADEFILGLPDGSDSIIGDRGVRLSGGQRQRLALARAIVRRPSILVLDEATSALDAESEAKVQHAVDRLTGSMTVLIVTHRLATVTGCNLIHVLDKGRLVESGSWDELLARKGRFAELVERQALAT